MTDEEKLLIYRMRRLHTRWNINALDLFQHVALLLEESKKPDEGAPVTLYPGKEKDMQESEEEALRSVVKRFSKGNDNLN